MEKQSFDSIYDAMFHGKYSSDDFLTCDVAREYTKIQTEDRVIYSQSKKLKDFQKFLNIFIFDFLDVNKRIVFSYRKGFNIVSGIEKHSKGKYFFQCDIEDFFNSIDEQMVVDSILRSVDRIPIIDIEKYIKKILEFTTINDSLPIGFSTSPAISNAALFEFDNIMEECCDKIGANYSRYSDDLIFSSQTLESIDEISGLVSGNLEMLYRGKFKLNAAKSRINHLGGRVKVLGMTITLNGQITIDSKLKRDIETLLYLFRKNKSGFIEKSGMDLDDATKRLSSYLSFINAVDSNYLKKLKNKYGSTLVDFFVHKPKEK